MYVLLWLNAVTALQMFFIERIFLKRFFFLFLLLFLKKMGILIASKPHHHSRFQTR